MNESSEGLGEHTHTSEGEGAPGATGETGEAGKTGEAGAAGAAGATGAEGVAGPSGAAGATGRAGAEGIEGPAGPAGPAGADLTKELRTLRADVGKLAGTIVSLGSDERLEKVVESVSDEEKRHRQRMTIWLVTPIILLIAISIGSWSQSRANAITLRNTKVVADYVRNCLTQPEHPDREECGDQSESVAVLGLIEFQRCALQILPEKRTDANMQACVERSLLILRGGE